MYRKNKGFILKLRDSKTFKGITVLVLLNFVFEMAQPSVSLALTEGPSQPEVQSFEPIGTSQMVDLFTGDFNYNIPLFNLPGPNGGYPVNLAYHAGATMDDEASWVGLGWNINVGSLVRNMRGLPDEFLSEASEESAITADANHDYLEVKTDMKQSWTLGARGSLSTEIFGNNLNNASLSASIYYNNYNGVGLSLGAGLDLGANSNYSVGLSLDSENGLGVSAALNLRKGQGDNIKQHKFGVSFDGSLSVDYSVSKISEVMTTVPSLEGSRSAMSQDGSSSSFGNSLTFARNAFSPSIANHVNNYNLSLAIAGGISGFGIFGKGSIGLFYNTQDFSDEDKKGRKNLVVGYDRLGESTVNHHFSKDFARVNDGQITKANMFLPISSYTYDVYSSSGQGLSGYFRPRRSDIGAIHDPYVYNNTAGASGSIQFGSAAGSSLGVDIGVNWGHNYQGRWSDANGLPLDFQQPEALGLTENLYYQAHGEMTILDPNEMTHVDGFNLPQIRLEDSDEDFEPTGRRRVKNNPALSASRASTNRVVRNTLIHNLKNKEVDELGEFDIKFFNQDDFNQSDFNAAPNQTLNREIRGTVNIEKHPAGYKILNNEGSYYVYALPAYNLKEVENLFSVQYPGTNFNAKQLNYPTTGSGSDKEVDYKINGTNKFIHKTTKSPYAHSYMLTSVQGADYVDISNNGPTDDDLGYWVKFDYFKKASDYKWRAPYNAGSAYYNKGASFSEEDDKASYSYGEKELWYLARIETKSHIAVFRLKEREDMLSATGEHDAGASIKAMYLDRIQIYEKKAFKANPTGAVPLQEIHFSYDYKLCSGTPNTSTLGANKKLTLTGLWMTYNGSNRGSLSKYEFDYGTQSFDNPAYGDGAYDSWGNYKPIGNKMEHASQFPYVNQFNQDWNTDAWEPTYPSGSTTQQEKAITKQQQDRLVSAWCLKKIKLPSGGEINIQYESDDYGYVQHKQANQMFKIHKLGDNNLLGNDELYDGAGNNDGDFYDDASGDDEKRRRVYFKLETPFPSSMTDLEKAQKVYRDYVEPLIQDENHQRNLFIKTKIRLTENVFDYLSGYFPLENNLTAEGDNNVFNYGVSADLKYGFVTLQPARRKNGNFFDNYHPISLAGWTYLQTNAQKLLNNPNSLAEEGTFGGARDLLGKLADVVNIIPMVANSFGAIRPYCRSKNMARYMNLDYSCIRLASPDKVKYGGGHRVKQISITDNWSADSGEQNRTYGQVYDYTMEENGQTISSGVAQYEPQAGGDENALKYPHFYYDKQNYFTNNNLFAEAPMNENLFPGASVGYRKVSVRSLNTDTQMKSATPKGRTGGVTVHEFFTAKEFPTIVENTLLAEENQTKHVFNLPIIIPLVGSIIRNNYHGVQSYKIELNDMHGKPKSVKSFELHNYAMNVNPITETAYEYQVIPRIYQGEHCFSLDNMVSVIQNDGNHQINPQKRAMGVEYDMFTDQRETFSTNNDFSLAMGIDFPINIFPGFVPTVWPSFNNQRSMFRTYVANKVIHRSGILKKTITRDLQTSNESEALAYDERSGQPLLTKMKNDFGDDFYSYNIPAYYHYDRMGHAYENINYGFSTTIYPQGHGHTSELYYFDGNPHLNNLFRGDELLVYQPDNEDITISDDDNYKKAYFIGWKYTGGSTKALLHFPNGGLQLPSENDGLANVNLKVIRSGRRNHYSSMVANYVTKGDPLSGLTDLTLSNTVSTKAFPQDKVLSASATVYNDNWASNYTYIEPPYIPGNTTDGDGSDGLDYNNGGAINRVINPFLNGNSGIWRVEKSYSFIGPRKTSTNLSSNTNPDPDTDQDPKLFNDGVFTDAVPMFSWDLGYMEDYVPKWEWVSEVTRYSTDSYETENVNRLGIFSSALYGYDNSLSIAVGGNADYHEMGFDDFEIHDAENIDLTHNNRTEQNNLNFYRTQSRNRMITSEQINIKHALANSDGTLTVELEDVSPYLQDFLNQQNIQRLANGNDYLNSSFGITLKSKRQSGVAGNRGYYFNGVVKEITHGGTKSLTIKIKPFYHCVNEAELELVPGTTYHGKLTVFEKRPTFTWTYSNVTFTNIKGHTGKRSLSINNGTAFFDQPKLKAKKDKKYIWSMWISRDNTDVKSYQANNLVVPGVMVNGAFVAMTSSYSVHYGKVVEGWQKIDIELQFGSDYPLIGLQFNPGASKLYVDDIRFSPKTGGITTYVYDPAKFWLRANLNVDNYATLFFYDEQGNLSLKKQETEKGIFTITESRGHVSEN